MMSARAQSDKLPWFYTQVVLTFWITFVWGWFDSWRDCVFFWI